MTDSDHGTLNSQPLGPELPDPVPCEVCGHPIWLGKDIVVSTPDGQPREFGSGVWEQDFPQPGQTWTLAQHVCRKVEQP